MSFFSAQSDRGDVEDLMGKVSARLSELERSGQLGNQHTALLPSGGQSISLDDQIRTLHAQWAINPNEIIHSSRPRFGEAIRRFQRLMRRATFWYTVPIIDQVSAFNGGVVRALAGLRSHQGALRDEIDHLAALTAARDSIQAPGQPETSDRGVADVAALRKQMGEMGARLAALEARLQTTGRDRSDD